MHIMNLVTGLKLRARINVKAFLSEKFWSKGAQNKKSLRHHEERAEQSQGKPSSSNQGVSKAAPLLGEYPNGFVRPLPRALQKIRQ